MRYRREQQANAASQTISHACSSSPTVGASCHLDSPAPAPLDRELAWTETRGPESQAAEATAQEIEHHLYVCHLQTLGRGGALTPRARSWFPCKRRLPPCREIAVTWCRRRLPGDFDGL
ncbi:hypothetical protein CGRA01v4_03673 [Colletotrichum graminicola]|nr:hypothetical protein CGRA01v4_03673 [Colletotrichum graminicola]